ncbi:MAG: DUF5103 domain-containing protein [Pseudopedobacter saltans]|uniref:DUF5103 domain-containing protein n=1 Tax=Pseudopedobacter saltans TaxID=151895 RepID=A0A2W5F6V4_9SPHI|nr:MAG: DUF5103 domain-containing protein [Pseudopedobacter saltans]
MNRQFYQYVFLFLLVLPNMILAQDETRMSNIKGIVLCKSGDQTSYPIINLGSTNALSLDFDDLSGGIKNYSYTYQLCNADWTPAQLSYFDFIQGFTSNRIMNYKVSSIATTQYTHYALTLPESNFMPTKSGNYILKVFLSGDTSQLAFSRRILIVDNRVSINLALQQPYDVTKMRTHQKLQFSLNNSALQITNPEQQIKVTVLKNYRWDIPITGAQPAFITGSTYNYNGEQDFVIPAGKEYRWLDLTSFRFVSDRIKSIDQNAKPFQVYAMVDRERSNTEYLPYQDYNGFFFIKATEQITPSFQGDYGNVHFVYQNYDKKPFPDQNVYIVGQFNNYVCDQNSLLHYNGDSSYYETNILLKQGYYNYIYVTKPIKNPNAQDDSSITEGDYWETENDYSVLVYYRSLNNRYVELVGFKTINTRGK